MKLREATVLREICSDGTEQYEMVCNGECVNYFATIDTAAAFARKHGYQIIEWIMD